MAAGAGERLGAGLPKAFVVVGGRSLVEHAVGRVLASGRIDDVVVVVPRELVARTVALLPEGVRVVAGGETRHASVGEGVRALSAPGLAAVDAVLVHDAARCLAPPGMVAAVVRAVRAGHPVVVPVVPVHDTVRALGPDGASSTLVDRARLRAVQTPQGFARGVLERAHAVGAAPGSDTPTDDASLAERLGHPVHLVPGAEEAFKVTRPLDLALAGALLARPVPA